jgi:hypothetical protein
LGLLVLLAGLAWPAMQNQITAAELPESADRLRSALFMARCEAMLEHRRFRIHFSAEEQHPAIEWEADPVKQPGVFVPSTADWAEQPILLADVQVHEIRPGRPVYMEALSETSDPDSLIKAADERERERVEREARNQGTGFTAVQDEKADPQRPSITFETDGSTEWATLILARVPPAQPLEEQKQQVWIVIDGRTGLVTIREKVTKEQLSDAKLYVKRENLELPDQTNLDDLTIEVTQNPTGAESTTGGIAENLDSSGGRGGAADAAATLKDLAKGTGQSSTGGAKEDPESDTAGAADELSVEKAVEESDLTEEEQGKVLRNFPRRGS